MYCEARKIQLASDAPEATTLEPTHTIDASTQHLNEDYIALRSDITPNILENNSLQRKINIPIQKSVLAI